MFGRGTNDDQLPGDDWANRRTTVPVTDKQGCYNPDVPGHVTVSASDDDFRYGPNSQN